ncbi:MAG: multicopper oxidase domain-containing protein, partial [Gammaproteobacteria bacterium]|nr:multicopper oxidase domain-containing protein [Gammaproteobacteria bacterium]
MRTLSLAVLLSLYPAFAWSATTIINPGQDNTVAEELPDNSSGVCDSVFAGNTDQGVGSARRALMQFDIAGAIPPGSIINSVTLSMTVTRGSNHVDSIFTVHPNNSAWVEGVDGCGVRGGGQGVPSTGGVTWNTRPANGGASASTLINNTSPVWNSTPALVSDVQGWLGSPASNFGWVVIGDETISTSSRRFDSREGGSPPALLIDYTPTGNVEACCSPDGSCVLALAGQCSETPLPGVDTCQPNQCPQPAGACCNADNSCTDNVDALTCENGGGTFAGGNCNQADCGLTPFVEALPIPPVLQPTGTRADGVPQYTMSVETATQSVHPDLPPTDLWTYNGSWPASTIVAQKGQPIEVTYQNNLPSGGGGNRGNNILEIDTCAHGPNYFGDAKRVVTHLHGGHLPARFDGQPEYTLLPGESDIYEYPNNQDAASLWYHDHALGITRLNVYGGMAGFYLLADAEDTLGPNNAFGFPSGQYEIGLAIQDRQFNADGSLFYNAQLEDAFKGDTPVVNGKVAPFLSVDQGKYRFRLLNGSQSREYIYRLENITNPGNDPGFTLVGTDLGLVSAPIDLGNTTGTKIAPAERLDVIIDFAGMAPGDEIILRNDDVTPPLLPSLMKFIVTGTPGYTGAINSTLRPVTPLDPGTADATRYFRLKKDPGAACKDGSGRTVNEWLVESLDGPGPGATVIGKYWDDLSEFPILGNREVWEFENPTNVMHPMHVHLVKFQILGKTDLTTGQPIPLEPWEANTWKDIVRIPANASARIIMDFTDYLGKFPQHCHILDHEDHEMMRQFQTINDPANCNNNGNCEVGEDCQSCPADCLQVSGAFCGNGLCEAGDGESCITCPADCNGKQNGPASKQFCCGAAGTGETSGTSIGCGVDINDDSCIDAGSNLFCRLEARVSACCGDALCEGQEDVQGPGFCQIDCDPQQACVPDETPEQSCFDGNDNDCDNQTDCADLADCDGATGAPTACGIGVCASTGNLSCSGGNQVDTCTPLPATEPGTE